MAFLQTLSKQSFDAQADVRLEYESVTDMIVEEFRKKCLRKAEFGLTSCKESYDLAARCSELLLMKVPDAVEGYRRVLERKVVHLFGEDHVSVREKEVCYIDRKEILMEISAIWPLNSAVPQRSIRSNVEIGCTVCSKMSLVVALTPCGHLVCRDCVMKLPYHGGCPVCGQEVHGQQNLFC